MYHRYTKSKVADALVSTNLKFLCTCWIFLSNFLPFTFFQLLLRQSLLCYQSILLFDKIRINDHIYRRYYQDKMTFIRSLLSFLNCRFKRGTSNGVKVIWGISEFSVRQRCLFMIPGPTRLAIHLLY